LTRGSARGVRSAAPSAAIAPSHVRVARGFFLLLGALPWALPVARSRMSLGEIGAAIDRVFVPMCHRFPARTLMLDGVQMPLCSRCAGLFAGFALAALLARPRWSMTVWRPVLIALGVAMGIEVLTQDLGLHPVWHPSRLATGFSLGYAMVTAFVTHLGQGAGQGAR
jgi:uncharacterized membrane protein